MTEDSPDKDLRQLDEEIIELLNRRAAMGDAPTPLRGESYLEQLNNGPLPATSLEAIYREIESAQHNLDRPCNVAFLGPEATFTHQAALKNFGHSAQFQGMDTIADVFDAVSKGRTDYGVVPVENSTEGAVRVTFDLFPNYDIHICAEVFLQIHHFMLARPDAGKIKRIYSHRQVLAQCRRWIQQNYPHCETIETSSTTLAAVKAAGEPDAAALASVLAAEQYGLDVVHANVEDSSNNITRFLVLGNDPVEPTGDDKTSVMFALSDRVGALYDALLPFKNNNVNMIMIESRPSKSQNWEYIFFVDLASHASGESCKAALRELSESCMFIKILGSYPRAPRG